MKTYLQAIVFTISLLCILSCKNSTISSAETDFAIKNIKIVDSVIIYNENQEITIVSNGGKWIVDNKYIAEQSAIERLINTLNLVQMNTPLPDDAILQVSKDIKNGTFVQVFSAKKLIKAFYIGDYMKGAGNYMMLKDAKNPYIVNVPNHDFDLRLNFSTNVSKWQSKIVFNLQSEEINSIDYENYAENCSFYLFRKESDFYVAKTIKDANAIKANNENAEYYLTKYANVPIVSFFDNYSQGSIDSLSNLSPLFEIMITKNAGEVINFKAYPIFDKDKKVNTDIFLALIDNQSLAIAKFYDFDLLKKNYDYFLK